MAHLEFVQTLLLLQDKKRRKASILSSSSSSSSSSSDSSRERDSKKKSKKPKKDSKDSKSKPSARKADEKKEGAKVIDAINILNAPFLSTWFSRLLPVNLHLRARKMRHRLPRRDHHRPRSARPGFFNDHLGDHMPMGRAEPSPIESDNVSFSGKARSKSGDRRGRSKSGDRRGGARSKSGERKRSRSGGRKRSPTPQVNSHFLARTFNISSVECFDFCADFEFFQVDKDPHWASDEEREQGSSAGAAIINSLTSPLLSGYWKTM